MEMEEIVGELIVGLLVMFLAYQAGVKGNIMFLHSYHYVNLDPKDKKIFTKRIGLATLLAGLGIFIMPVLNLISGSEFGYYIGVILVFFGVFLLIFYIIKYNGSLFGLWRR